MKKFVMALGAVALATLAASMPAQAQVRAGLLTCEVAPGVSFVVGSQKALHCVYQSAHGKREHYVGQFKRVGFDVGFTTGGQIAWAVYAPSKHGPGSLAGAYVGAVSEATIGAGVAANVLVGGFKDSVSLQPVSVGTQQGLGVAGGAGSLELQPADGHHRHHHHHH